MSAANLIRLLAIATLWGTSFMLMRIASPAFGPFLSTFWRALLGGLTLYLFARSRGVDFGWRRNRNVYLVIGLANTAVPFSLFSWAALYIPASYMATMMSLAPIFTAVFGFLLLGERMTPMRMAAFVLGLLGVAVLVGVGPTAVTFHVILGVLAGVGGAVSYGYATIYTRMKAMNIPPLAGATGSQVAAALALLPLSIVDIPHAMVAGTVSAAIAVVVLGVACTAVAYALFFHLISTEGASKAITVTFLTPATASIWAWLLLDEPVTLGTVVGIAIVLCSTALALGLVDRRKAVADRS
jgi:drug/metabolite transporter (DMT)-like permease